MRLTLPALTLLAVLATATTAAAQATSGYLPGPAASDPPAQPKPRQAPERIRLLDRFRAAPAPSREVPPAPPSPSGRPGRPSEPKSAGPLILNNGRDPRLQRTQALSSELRTPPPPGASIPAIATGPGQTVGVTPAESPESISLEAALYGAITSNPDVVALRQNSVASPEAVEVARRFSTALNPTLWVDVRPYAYERIPASLGSNGQRIGGRMQKADTLMYFSLRQPIELGHQTTHRHEIAKAALSQQQWNVVQAEILALVQTYRFFQTAAYRREKVRVAAQLSEFNVRLLESLKKRLDAGQVPAADVALASVEMRAAKQILRAAEQDYLTALTDLRIQIGRPETAGTAEPLGDFVLPAYIPDVQDDDLVQLALQSRPEIQAARAGVAGAKAATNLARADRMPSPVIGPVYERDEQGTQFLGLVYITQLPVWNNGTPLVRQREADTRRAMMALQNAQARVVSQVKAAVARWNGANGLVRDTATLTDDLAKEVSTLERLFDAGQTDLGKLLQARQRLIQLKNAELDATWSATQAQADLLVALGAPTLIGSLQAGAGDAPAAVPSRP